MGDGPAEKGLSLLVQQILGRPLDKIEQLSNWERRPLRTSQLRYAGRYTHTHTHMDTHRKQTDFSSLPHSSSPPAADAYCLLEVYSALSKDPAGFGLPADLHSVSSAQAGKKTKEDKKRKEKAKQARQREVRGQPSPSVITTTAVPVDVENGCYWGDGEASYGLSFSRNASVEGLLRRPEPWRGGARWLGKPGRVWGPPSPPSS